MNTRLQAFQEFLAAQSLQVPVWDFMINLFCAAVLSYVLARVYVRFGTSLSNREEFARNFVLLAMTTALIITIIKSSLALSLGLVGALSIVRFRAAIKEPEELTYLFLNIAIGLGMGAQQRLVTTAAFAMILAAIWLKKQKHGAQAAQDLYLNISGPGGDKIELGKVVALLREHCAAVDLKRFDLSSESLEAAFLVELKDFDRLKICTAALRSLDEGLKVSFLDNKGLL